MLFPLSLLSVLCAEPFKTLREEINKVSIMEFSVFLHEDKTLAVKNGPCAGESIEIFVDGTSVRKQDIPSGNKNCGVNYQIDPAMIVDLPIYRMSLPGGTGETRIKIVVHGNKLADGKMSQQVLIE
ncbi:MAG: uncharacterized protein A8A55_1742 [Amphiamblys sp. WSBS2006]|nr:MAG: uncharacterized protein A8A55_1742 [Amphiamblys sp. WSBS2006]